MRASALTSHRSSEETRVCESAYRGGRTRTCNPRFWRRRHFGYISRFPRWRNIRRHSDRPRARPRQPISGRQGVQPRAPGHDVNVRIVVPLALMALVVACGGEKDADGSAQRSTAETLPTSMRTSSLVPVDRLIVPNRSIGRIRLGEPRSSVEKAFGRGKLSRGWVSYFGGHLLVDYVHKVRPTKRVQAIRTPWIGYRTRSGVQVGSSRQDLRRALHAACGGPTRPAISGRRVRPARCSGCEMARSPGSWCGSCHSRAKPDDSQSMGGSNSSRFSVSQPE